MNVKFYFLFVGVFLLSLRLHAQCTDVTISSQSDVDSFASTHGCTTLSGRLLISGNDITNLDGLSALTSIGGLTITNNPNLLNIDGLSSVQTVSGPDARIELNGNLALTDIDGLSSLTTFSSSGTGGWISFSSNPSLKNLDGLFFLREIYGENSARLDVTFNESLENIDGLSSLQRLENNNAGNRPVVSIIGNHALTRGCGLYKLLTGPQGPQQCEVDAEPDDYGRCIDFVISNNSAGVTQEGIIAGGDCTLSGCNGDINLSSQADVDAFPANYGCSIVKGRIEIVSIHGEVTNLDSLYQIVRAKDLIIAQNFYLENIEGLSSLQTVDEIMSITGSTILQSLHGLENLTTVKDLGISLNSFDDLTGLSGLTSVSGSFKLNANALSSLQGLDNLTSIGALAITNDTTLTNLDAFPALTDIGGIAIQNNQALASISFPAMQSTGSFTVSGNPMLSGLSMPALQSVTNLNISDNDMLANLGGLSTLTSTTKIEIVGNANLTSIQALSGVASAPDGIHIASNPSLANLNGLGGITTTNNLVTIANNAALTSLSGLAFTHVGMLWVLSNANLVSLDGLGSLKTSTDATNCECSSIGTRIVNNAKLPNLDALSSLEKIGGMLEITGNAALTNVDGLMNLTSIGTNYVMNDMGLMIQDNPSLVSLSGLQKITTLGGTFITNNDALTTLHGLHNVTSMRGPAIRIEGNAMLTDIDLSHLKSITTGLVINDNAALLNLDGLQSLTTIGGTSYSYIDISNNALLANVDSLTNFVNLTTPQKSINVVDNPNLTKGCGFYPMLHRYFPCADCSSAFVTFSGNGTTKEQILADGPCEGSGPATCENVTLSSQADVDTFNTMYGCTVITGLLKISGDDITNLDGLTGVTTVGAFYISGNDSLTSLRGLDSLKFTTGGGQFVAAFIGSSIDNNPSLVNIDALSKLTKVGGMLRIENNASLTNLDGLSSLTTLGYNDGFGNASLSIYKNPALVSTSGLHNLVSVPGGLYIADNDALQAIEGFGKVTSTGMNGFNISDNAVLTDISGFSHLEHIAGGISITNNAMLPNLNGLRSLTGLSGKQSSLIDISNNPMLTDVDSLSNFIEVSTPQRRLKVTNNPNLTRGCGLYPLLVLAFDCVICETEVNFSGNGEGVTEEGITSGGACDGVEPPITAQATNLVFSEVTSTSMRLSFTPPKYPSDGYVTLMRVGQSPHPEDAPRDGSYWYPGTPVGNSVSVYNESDSTFVVTGLMSGTDYYFAIYSNHDLVYVKDEPLQGHQSTLGGANPGTLAFGNVTDNSMDVTFLPDSGRAGYLTVMRAFESALPDEGPENGATYSIGNVIGCCSIVVGLGMDSTLSVIYLEPDIEYYFDVIPYVINSGTYSYDTAAAISGHQRTMPRVQPYPNPFVEEVVIPFTINEEEGNVKIMILDQMGRAVSEVVNDRFVKGKHEVRWMRTDMQGNRAVDGVYMYSIITNNNEPVKGLFVAK